MHCTRCSRCSFIARPRKGELWEWFGEEGMMHRPTPTSWVEGCGGREDASSEDFSIHAASAAPCASAMRERLPRSLRHLVPSPALPQLHTHTLTSSAGSSFESAFTFSVIPSFRERVSAFQTSFPPPSFPVSRDFSALRIRVS